MSKRCFSFLMAALLVLSTVMVAAPVKSQAAVTDQTYTLIRDHIRWYTEYHI